MAYKRLLLRRLRMARGLSQSELARIVGCGSSEICKIENGRETPYSIRAGKIADALKWQGSTEELLADDLNETQVEQAIRDALGCGR